MDVDPDESEQVGLSGIDLLNPTPRTLRFERNWKLIKILTAIIVVQSFVALILGGVALHRANEHRTVETVITRYTGPSVSELGLLQRSKPISRIAFGSCTSYVRHPQTIWTRGVIPSDPDMWIWLGDFIYFDTPLDPCTEENDNNVPECRCNVTLFTYPPFRCAAGNITFAREKVKYQLLDRYYYQFLEFMCPNLNQSIVFPPIGDRCEKPIIGTYDDHDYGVNNANRYLSNKFEFKNLYLDAIGVEQSSSRRSAVAGLETKYTINPDGPENQKIDVFLLDERYERDKLPCEVRREWCERVLAKDKVNHDYLWCDDFLNTGGPGADGSCCRADDVWANGWCKENPDSEEDDELWDIACDPSSERFSSIRLELDNDTNTLKPIKHFNVSDRTYTSQFCDVLGMRQRAWFQEELKRSTAPLKLIGSGSVLLGNPIPESHGPCSSDDIQCYQVAQSNLIHILDRVDNGCVIVLTGDYHQSDIKMIQRGRKQNYSSYYPTKRLHQPIYQIMSSGLTEVTASSFKEKKPCRNWREDQVGLRPFGRCSFVARPAFGMLEIDWEERIVHLQLRSDKTGEIAKGLDGRRQELSVDIDTCQIFTDS